MAHIHVKIKPWYLTVMIISTFLDSVRFIFEMIYFSQTQKEYSNITEDKRHFQAVQRGSYS